MNYYLSVVKSGRSLSVHRAGDRVTGVEFELEGQRFMGLNAMRQMGKLEVAQLQRAFDGN